MLVFALFATITSCEVGRNEGTLMNLAEDSDKPTKSGSNAELVSGQIANKNKWKSEPSFSDPHWASTVKRLLSGRSSGLFRSNFDPSVIGLEPEIRSLTLGIHVDLEENKICMDTAFFDKNDLRSDHGFYFEITYEGQLIGATEMWFECKDEKSLNVKKIGSHYPFESSWKESAKCSILIEEIISALNEKNESVSIEDPNRRFR